MSSGPAKGREEESTKAPLPLLAEPAEGVPDVITRESELIACADAISAGVGPVALDAERASGYRYGQAAYLVQLRREGSGTWLIDPVFLPDLQPVDEAIGTGEWILHAATQDLACLRDVGLVPRQIFDTELGARLLGLPRVGLAAVIEHYLGISLAKEHSAVDWSTRPLPEPWLRYAALDVEVLTEVRNLMGADLAAQGKSEWARQEFTALLDWRPTQRQDPWRRTSGLHKIRQPRILATVRELWWERDRIARERDTSPGRVIPDAALVEIAQAAPAGPGDLPRGHRAIQRSQRAWLAAVERARELGDDELPPPTLKSDGPPPQRSWANRDPLAAERLTATRAALTAFAEEHTIPIENVCSPDPLRRVVWSPPSERGTEGFAAALAEHGVRPWQQEIVAPLLVAAFEAHPDA
ncbi:HRDC domain-containing protein [Janibacter cremeus]|uniref:HRDC domain-containing protein n=1 Tax=Janibacter cremeus TaxID=1285192 RepID=UPI0023F9C1A0|nr:HRDC domain-containing protein [Janibacter cremeus]WEV78987.1 HRDC domain-containing protein [Janibacter cremeus]